MSGLLTLGESLGMIRADAVGGFDDVASASIDTGGAEGNVAIGVVRLGGAATWLGRVGDDALGRRVVADLRGQGVKVIAPVDSAHTGLMLKSRPSADRTRVDYYRQGSAGSHLQPADLDAVGFADHRILHVTGITLAISASARATAREAVARARAAGLAVSFAVNHRERLWRAADARAVYLEFIAAADVVFASEDEAALVLGGDASGGADATAGATASALAALGPSEAIVTLGELGCAAVIDGTAFRVDAVPVTVADTVGAGDAFTAGYLAEHLAGAAADVRLATAVRAGAAACGHPSDWRGALRRGDLGPSSTDPVSR